MGPGQRPRQPLRAAQFLMPAALPGARTRVIVGAGSIQASFAMPHWSRLAHPLSGLHPRPAVRAPGGIVAADARFLDGIFGRARLLGPGNDGAAVRPDGALPVRNRTVGRRRYLSFSPTDLVSPMSQCNGGRPASVRNSQSWKVTNIERARGGTALRGRGTDMPLNEKNRPPTRRPERRASMASARSICPYRMPDDADALDA